MTSWVYNYFNCHAQKLQCSYALLSTVIMLDLSFD
jgi:hypothetical protein